MLCFYVGIKTEPGLPVSSDPYPHVSVGSVGGRGTMARVPLGSKDFRPLPERLLRASFLRTREKGTLLLVKERELDRGDPRALVLINVPPLFHGTQRWEFPSRDVDVLAEGEHDMGPFGVYTSRLMLMGVGSTIRVRRFSAESVPSVITIHWDGRRLHDRDETRTTVARPLLRRVIRRV